MAKPRTVDKSPPTNTRTAPKKEKAEQSGDVKIDVAQVATAVSSLPQPTELEVAAWTSQYPEAYALSLAAQTRAPAILGDAWGWFQTARPTLEGPLASLVKYPKARLAFLGHCTLTLADAIEAERAKKRGASKLSQQKTSSEALAQAALSDLRASLRETAGRHPGLTDDLNTRLAEPTSSSVSGALLGLAGLLDEWLVHVDPLVRTLVATHMLTADDATRAREAAATLTGAATAKRGNTSTDRDSAEISPLEGRVLVEMRALRNAFINARERSGNKRIPALVPSPATRAVFGRGSAAADPPPPTPTPA